MDGLRIAQMKHGPPKRLLSSPSVLVFGLTVVFGLAVRLNDASPVTASNATGRAASTTFVPGECPRGYGVVQEATHSKQIVCEKCEAGVTFSDEISATQRCEQCTDSVKCELWQPYVKCQPMLQEYCSDLCDAGEFFSLVFNTCKRCSTSCRDNTTEFVLPCANFSDAECAPIAPKYLAPPPTTTIAPTTILDITTSFTPQPRSSTPRPNTGPVSARTEEDGLSTGGIVAISVSSIVASGVFILVVSIIVVHVLRQHKASVSVSKPRAESKAKETMAVQESGKDENLTVLLPSGKAQKTFSSPVQETTELDEDKTALPHQGANSEPTSTNSGVGQPQGSEIQLSDRGQYTESDV